MRFCSSELLKIAFLLTPINWMFYFYFSSFYLNGMKMLYTIKQTNIHTSFICFALLHSCRLFQLSKKKNRSAAIFFFFTNLWVKRGTKCIRAFYKPSKCQVVYNYCVFLDSKFVPFDGPFPCIIKLSLVI